MYIPEIILMYQACILCYYIHINPRKPIIMKIVYNNWTTYTMKGKTDGINMCMCL